MNLENLTIHSSITQAEYASLLLNVSIGLFSLSQQHTAHNFPGKLLVIWMQASLFLEVLIILMILKN